MNKERLIREIEKAYEHQQDLKELIRTHDKIIVLGNGGSNAVAAHIAQDYTKMLGKKAFSFTDPSRLTCYINDYGMENANAQFVKEFADPIDTLVVIISSSGNSENMLNVMRYCIELDINYVILTGFGEANKMRDLNQTTHRPAKLDIWVESHDYGIVECVHQVTLHSVLGD
jgi:D-sedoheptulose 7-phosphate isomerase